MGYIHSKALFSKEKIMAYVHSKALFSKETIMG